MENRNDIYLDNASTTKMDDAVLDAMFPFLTRKYGNAGSIHEMGIESNRAVEAARESVAELIGSSPEHIIFTSGGTESNNMVFKSTSRYLQRIGKTHIISAWNEHDSVLKSIEAQCANECFSATEVDTNADGSVSLREIESSMCEDTGIASFMYVNNETGSRNDVCGIGRLCAERGILFHTDCVQAAGDSVINVSDIGCDFLSISSHKIHGPKGVGAMFVKNMDIVEPMIVGGSAQEFCKRGGTQNTPGIVGFGVACDIARRCMKNESKRLSFLKKRFYAELLECAEKFGIAECVHVNGSFYIDGMFEAYSPKIINVRFDGVDGETLVLMLNSFGIYVSSGAACKSHESTPSRSLMSMGLTEKEARSSIRVSFSKYNTPAEISVAADKICECVSCLKGGLK